MANWNYNYIYGVPPTEVYQEYGVYDETIDTSTVPLDYVGPIYNIPYIGVESYVLNGTTYYNYNLYEIPVFSYPVYDYVAESYPDVYVSEYYTSTVDVIDDVNVSQQYSSSDHDSISSDPQSSSAVSITSYSDSSSTSISYYNSFNNSSSVSNNSYILESNVLFTETFNSSYNSFQSLNENAETTNQNISYPSTYVENFADIKNEITDFETESDSNSSDCNTQAYVHNYNDYDVLQQVVKDCDTDYDNECEEHLLIHEENKVCDCTIEIEDDDTKESDNVLCEESDNTSFISYENKILDWTVEVDEDDEKTDDHDDSIKVKLSSANDIDPYNSADVVKYLKEELYRYALSGHMSLKESIPVVHILPIIKEESESIEEIDALEKVTDGLEYSAGDVLEMVIEKDAVANITFDMSESFMKSYDLVSQVEDSEEITKNLPGFVEMYPSSVRDFYIPQQNLTNRHQTQKGEMVNNEGKLLIKETEVLSLKNDSKALSSDKDFETSVENAMNSAHSNDVNNAELQNPNPSNQIHQTEKGNIPKLQKDSVKIMEEIEAIEIRSLCQNDQTLLKSDERDEIRKELISKKIDSNHMSTCHVPQKAEHHDECHTKGFAEKTVKSRESVSCKTKKKRFQNLRKWLGNLCCWVKKKS